MKVLVVCHVRWFNAEAYYALTLCELFRRHGHEVLLMTHPGGLLAERARERGVAMDAGLDILSSSPLVLFRSLLGFCRLLRDFRPDLVTVHRSESFFFTVLSRFIVRSRSCVLRFRGDPRAPRNTVFNRWLYNSQSQRVVVPGSVIKRTFISNLAIPESHVEVVYAPVNADRFSPVVDKRELKRGLGFGPDRLLVGVVGRIGRVKGHEFLLQTIEKLPVEHGRVHFFIAYHEEHEGVQAFKRTVEHRNLSDRISFFGYTPEIEQLVAAADVGVISSIGSEANCRVALEFMACGVPLVATEVGVIPEVVQHDVTGFIVPPRQPARAAEVLSRLLSDESLRTSMGRAAREVVEQRFSRTVFYEKVQRLIRENCPDLPQQ